MKIDLLEVLTNDERIELLEELLETVVSSDLVVAMRKCLSEKELETIGNEFHVPEEE